MSLRAKRSNPAILKGDARWLRRSAPRAGIHVRIVLVRPRNPFNIGAAARAMANFGFSDLAVVKPHAPVWRETVSAVGAERLVREARVARSLAEAVADCHCVIATTALRNRRIARPLIHLPELNRFLSKKGATVPPRVAVLFGPEKTGLPNRYLEESHAILRIPTSPKTPSMNLGQAVAVCCYELARLKGSGVARKTDFSAGPPQESELRQLVQHTMRLFETVDFLNFLKPEQRLEKIHRTYRQWNLKRHDLALIHGIFRFVRRKLSQNSLKRLKPEY